MKRLNVLIVDDDGVIGALIAELLDEVGHVVCGIETTEEGAVAVALQSKPDLMIVDANLRTGSGIGAITRIARTVAIPSILMSGDRLPISVGTAVTLQKPFTCSDLLIAIGHVTGAVQIDPAPSVRTR